MRHIIMLLLLFAAPSSLAQLQWPELQVERTAEVGAESATGTFAFTNAGEQPIEITQVRTSCGCTTAALDQTTYAPGDPGRSGAITATLTLGARTGVIASTSPSAGAPSRPATRSSVGGVGRMHMSDAMGRHAPPVGRQTSSRTCSST